MDAVIIFLTCTFGILLSVNFLYPLILKILKKKNVDFSNAPNHVLKGEPDYAIIVTFFECINLLPGIIESIDGLDYENFVVYVVADGCDISSITCPNSKIILLRPPELLKSNVKSHKYAIANFIRLHERVTIIDGDNLITENYLSELNKMFSRGYIAVQGARNAKNLNNEISNLDAVGDLYYRYVDRKLLFEAGSSAALSGSGMAFTTRLYIECIKSYNVEGAGFDKFLQYEIVNRNIRIGFSNEAIVYDQKTATSDQLVKQRARWISTWLKAHFIGLSLFIKSLVAGERNGLLFSIALLRPPLFILFTLSIINVIINFYIIPFLNILWAICFFCFVATFFKALKTMNAPRSMYKSLTTIPKFVMFQFTALLKSNKADKLSTVTKHSQIISVTNSKK